MCYFYIIFISINFNIRCILKFNILYFFILLNYDDEDNHLQTKPFLSVKGSGKYSKCIYYKNKKINFLFLYVKFM
jgi:hypothetical protein